jgi:copper(I)-binding protein
VQRTRLTRIAAVALAAALVPSLAACGSGFDAGTIQGDSGNGVSVDVGPLQVRDLTLVQGPEGTRAGTFVLTIVNTSDEADELLGVTVKGDSTAVGVISGPGTAGGRLELPPLSRTQIGYVDTEVTVDVAGIDVAPTAYVPVELRFAKAGTVERDVMAAVPILWYDGIAPAEALGLE